MIESLETEHIAQSSAWTKFSPRASHIAMKSLLSIFGEAKRRINRVSSPIVMISVQDLFEGKTKLSSGGLSLMKYEAEVHLKTCGLSLKLDEPKENLEAVFSLSRQGIIIGVRDGADPDQDDILKLDIGFETLDPKAVSQFKKDINASAVHLNRLTGRLLTQLKKNGFVFEDAHLAESACGHLVYTWANEAAHPETKIIYMYKGGPTSPLALNVIFP